MNKERVVDLLQKELINDSFVPEGVISILTNDLKDKKNKKHEFEEKREEHNRIDEHKLFLIRKEFNEHHGRERQLKVLDFMLGGMKFL